MSDPNIMRVDELKIFFKSEVRVLGLDLKELKQDLRSLNFKFAQFEGKLLGLEEVSHHTHADIRIFTSKIETNEDKTKNLEALIQNQEQEIRELGEDWGEIAETVESMDNI